MPTTFHINKEHYNLTLSKLRRNLNKDYALRLYSELKGSFEEPFFVDDQGKLSTLDKFISPRKIREYRTDELLMLLALFVSDNEGMFRYFNSLQEEYLRLLTILLRQKWVSYTYLKSLEMDDITYEEKSSWYYDDRMSVKEHKLWFECISSYDYSNTDRYHKDYYFTLNEKFSWIASVNLLPFEERWPYMEELPTDIKLEIFDAESDAFISYPVIRGLVSQKSLKFSSFKVTRASSLKTMSQLPIRDICIDFGETNMRYNLGQTLFPYINYAMSHVEDNYPAVARGAYRSLNYLPVSDNLSNLLPFIKGFKANSLANYGCSNVIALAKQSLVESGGSWIDVRCLSYRTITCGSSIVSRGFDFNTLVNAVTGFPITPDTSTENIDLPLLQSYYSVLYGLGGLSIACTEQCPDTSITPFDHIRYVRLNNFGKYLIGLTESYSAPGRDKVKMFELDDKHLIIRSLHKSNPYESLLSDLTVSIGGGRYKISPYSFLSKCKDKTDVQKKIQFFKDYICDELPPIWVSFFDDLQKRCNPFVSDNNNYYLFKIDPSDKDLINILSTDEGLKKLLIKAEGFRFLVAEKDNAEFEQRLKRYGYLA